MWVKLDDRVNQSDKLIDISKDAALLWFRSLPELGALDTDGRIGARYPAHWCRMFAVARRAVTELVERGLWHDRTTIGACFRCTDLHGVIEPGEYVAHDFMEINVPSAGRNDSLARQRDLRKKQLHRDTDLVNAVRRRDLDRCRYCGVHTVDPPKGKGGNRRSKQLRELDHVDPFGDNSLENVVVACKGCNSTKKDHTLEEIGMALLPPPKQAQINANQRSDQPSINADQPENQDAINADPSRTRDSGRDWSGVGRGVGSGVDPGLVESGNGLSNGHANGVH